MNVRPSLAGLSCIFGLMFLAMFSASAQEALQNSLAGQNAGDARTQQMQSQDYTIRDGDFRLLLVPSLEFDWNDNINLSKTNVLDDFIARPSVGITASYPLSQRNLLYLDISIGYDRYFKNPSLSTLELNSSSGTGLSFDVGIKDVTLNFHDWLSYEQDSAQTATVANTASYGTFQNTAGLAATWDLNQATLSLGYDHQNVLSTESQYDSVNHASEMLFGRVGLQVHPQVNVGLESSASFTAYDKDVLNNNDAYTIGAYTEFRPGTFFKITARGGYSIYKIQQTSASIQTSSQNSWYAGLNLSHQPRESVSYSIAAGREVQFGIASDLVEDWYVRPNITWNIIKGLSFNTSLFYEHGSQGVGNIAGNLTETYDWYGGEFRIEHALTSRFTLGLNYRLTLRSSNSPDDGYKQNLVGLQLTYRPK